MYQINRATAVVAMGLTAPNLPGYIDADEYDKVFFDANFTDGANKKQGGFFAFRPKNQPTGWSPNSPHTATYDAQGNIDMPTQNQITSFFQNMQLNVNGIVDPAKDYSSPVQVKLYGAEYSTSPNDKEVALMKQITNFVNQNYPNQFHFEKANTSTYGSSGPFRFTAFMLTNDQFAFTFTIETNFYQF